MKKTIIIPIIIVLLLSSFTIVSNALSFTVTLSPEIANVPPGQTIDLYLSANNLNIGSEGMNIFSFILNYDTTIFEEITTENITGLNGWNLDYDSVEKRVLMDNQKHITEESQLCKITLKVKNTITTGTTQVSITNPTTSNKKLEIAGVGCTATINVKQISSEKYEITTDNKITGVELDTTVDSFKTNIVGSENAVIKDKDGNILTSGKKVGTGATVSIPGEEPLTVIVRGDVNGDGTVTITDLAKVQLHIVKLEILSGPYLEAAEINEDNTITITDLAKLQLHILKLETL